MGHASYEHVEAPEPLNINGVRAFNVGSPVPMETAKRLGLLDRDPPLEVFPGRKREPVDFTDAPLIVATEPNTPSSIESAPTSGLAKSKTPGKPT